MQNFDLIGLGELKYSEQFVEKGEVDERIRVRDIRFMAEKMKLRMPPLPISHWEEIKIFNYFMKENNTLSNSKCVELAELYKEKCNGIQIFLKLPSMIKQYYKQWKANSLIKLAQNAMKENYDRLLGLYSS